MSNFFHQWCHYRYDQYYHYQFDQYYHYQFDQFGQFDQFHHHLSYRYHGKKKQEEYIYIFLHKFYKILLF